MAAKTSPVLARRRGAPALHALHAARIGLIAAAFAITGAAAQENGVAVSCIQPDVINASLQTRCISESNTIVPPNLTGCADALGALAHNDAPCCFDAPTDCDTFATSINTQRSPSCGVGEWVVANVSSSGLRTCSAYCGASQYIMTFPSFDPAFPTPGICLPQTVCGPDEYRSQPALCCSNSQLDDWFGGFFGSVPAAQVCPTPVNCASPEATPWSNTTTVFATITDAVCSPITSCMAGQYAEASATSTTDTVCAAIKECYPYNETVAVPSTNSSNTVCEPATGPVFCALNDAGPGSWEYSSYMRAHGADPAAVIWTMSSTVANNNPLPAMPNCHESSGLVVPVFIDSFAQNWSICVFVEVGNCSSAAVFINEVRTPPCPPGQFVTTRPTNSSCGDCQAGCATNQRLVSFPARNSSDPGLCVPMTQCGQSEYQRAPGRCCSDAQLTTWVENTGGSGVLPVEAVCTVVGDDFCKDAFWPDGDNPVYISNPRCSPTTQCSSSELTSAPATLTSDAICVPKSETTTSSGHPTPRPGIVVLWIVLVFIIVGLGVKFYRSNKSLDETLESFELQTKLLDTEREHNQRVRQAWEIAADQLSFGETIASGASGTVYRGKWAHIPVAIKTPRQDSNVELDNEEFAREAALMQSIRSVKKGVHLLHRSGAPSL